MVTRLLAMLFALHPLHTTMTEVTVDPTTRTVRATTRVFADDLRRAAGSHITSEDYVAGGLAIVDASRRPIVLHGCGVKQTGEVLWVCVEGAFTGSFKDLRLSNALLCDLFDNQVNVVQINSGGVRKSVLFVKGDGMKGVL